MIGDGHGVNAAPSRLHSKVEPGSSEESDSCAEVEAVVPVGPVAILVSGGVTSVPSSGRNVCQ